MSVENFYNTNKILYRPGIIIIILIVKFFKKQIKLTRVKITNRKVLKE